MSNWRNWVISLPFETSLISVCCREFFHVKYFYSKISGNGNMFILQSTVLYMFVLVLPISREFPVI